jgi:electron transfer flavoprotein beta subunit
MKIVVCIKQVPDTNEIKINPATGTLIREGVPAIMNPDDKSGLEMALQLKQLHKAEVTVITMGPPQADSMLREALAMGADNAILLTDKRFAGADTLATSTALAAALRKLDFDLVIAGRQAIDGDTAQVGPQTAEHLGLPQVTYADMISYSPPLFTIRRVTEDGYEYLESESPMLVTVVSSANHPRYMTVKGIVQSYKRTVQVWSADDLDADQSLLGLKGSPTKVKSAFAKGMKQSGQIYEVEAEEAVGIIISKLQDKFII